MAFVLTGRSRYLARAATIALVGFGASACSMVPDWMGGDSGSAPAATAADQADQQQAANATSPDLANVPDKPVQPSTPDEQKALTQSLGADHAQNQYSAEQLRGGTEAAAAAPSAASAANQVASSAAPTQPASAPPPAAAGTPPSDSGSIDAAAASNADQTPAAPVPPAPATTTADNSAPAAAPPPSAQDTAPAVPAVPASSGGPAVPATSYGTYSAASSMVSPSDAALGFKPSMAPPLNASVAQFVPQPVIARYQQTAQMSRSAYTTSQESAYSAAPVSNGARGGSQTVVANYTPVSPDVMPMTSYMSGGSPSAVVAFAGDRTILNAEAKAQVHAAAAAFMQSGGQGYIRVVGHAASGGNLSSARHMALNLEHSQARATAVARELIKNGVPADKVLVQASGDDGAGASAEIFLQS